MIVDAKLKVVTVDDAVRVLCEIQHPVTDANYVTQVVFRVNGDARAELLLGRNVAAHPVVGTNLPGLKAGDRIEAAWRDLRGARGSASMTWSGQDQ